MRVERVLVVAVVFLFLVSLGFGQTQGRTEHFAYPIAETGRILGNCGDFDLLVDYAAIIKGVVIFDKEGQWVREVDQIKVIGQDMYYNSERPDLFLLGGPGEVEIDLYDAEGGTVALAGLSWKVKVPGYGVIYIETGRAVLDFNTGELLSNSGHNQYFDEDIAAICSCLTP